MSERTCRVDDCEKSVRCRDLCAAHYARFLRTGIAEAPVKPSITERFWSKVDASGDCWEWTAGKTSAGYGAFKYEHYSLAHRFAYELLVGAIPAHLVLDHLCRNRVCVNPDHLEPVTLEENIRRGVAGSVAAARGCAKTQCLRGHAYTEANTYVAPRTGKRRCKACHRAAVARANRGRRATANDAP